MVAVRVDGDHGLTRWQHECAGQMRWHHSMGIGVLAGASIPDQDSSIFGTASEKSSVARDRYGTDFVRVPAQNGQFVPRSVAPEMNVLVDRCRGQTLPVRGKCELERETALQFSQLLTGFS